jgi:hypothetical protein
MKQNILIIIGLCFLFGCSKVVTNNLYTGGRYKLNYYKTRDKLSTKIYCEFYNFELENEKTIGIIKINGVFLPIPTDYNGQLVTVSHGNYKIETGFLGKKWTIIEKLKMNKGDSVVLKFYLEDDDRPLVD